MESFNPPQEPELELHNTIDTLGREQHFLINANGNKERISRDEYEDFLPKAVVSQDGLITTKSKLIKDLNVTNSKPLKPEVSAVLSISPESNDRVLYFPGNNATATVALTKEDGTYFTYGEAVEAYNKAFEKIRSIDTEGKSKEEVRKEFDTLQDEVYKFDHYIAKADGSSTEDSQKRLQTFNKILKNFELKYGINEGNVSDVNTPPEPNQNLLIAEKSGLLYTLLLNKIEDGLNTFGRKAILQNPRAKKAYLKDLLKLNEVTALESVSQNGGNSSLDEDIKAVFFNPNSVLSKIGVKHEELVEAGIIDLMAADPTQLNSNQLSMQNRNDIKSLFEIVSKEKQDGKLSDDDRALKEMLYGRIFIQNSHTLFNGKPRSEFGKSERISKEKLLESQMKQLDALRDGRAKVVEDEKGAISIIMLTPVELAGYGEYAKTGVTVSDGKALKGTLTDISTDPDANTKGHIVNQKKKLVTSKSEEHKINSKGNKKKYALLAGATLGAVGLVGVGVNELKEDISKSGVTVLSAENTKGEQTEEVDNDVFESDEYKELQEKYEQRITELNDEIQEIRESLETRNETLEDRNRPAESSDSNDDSIKEVNEDNASENNEQVNEEVVPSTSNDQSKLVSTLRQEDIIQYTYPWDWAQNHNFDIRKLVTEAQAKGYNFGWNLQSSSDRDDILLYNGSDNTVDVVNALIDSLEE